MSHEHAFLNFKRIERAQKLMKVISRQVAGGCVVPCYDYDRSQPIKLNLELPGNENLEPSKIMSGGAMK